MAVTVTEMRDSQMPAIDRDNPWPGLAAYEEDAREFFSGRDAESTELARRIRDEAVTVLFGKSGLGKSSLLRAGVFPLLRERGFLPVVVRLQYGGGSPEAMEQVAAALFAEFDAGQIEYPARRAGETFWEYLHRDGLAFWAPKIRPARPVLVFDQFEEVFTLGRGARQQAEAFREQLADLAENRIPAVLAERLNTAGDAPSGLDVNARPCKIVLSLREDFLPELEGWLGVMPSLRRNRMRLLPMGPRQALGAIHNPHTDHLLDEALARRIVDFLGGGVAGTAGDADTAMDEGAAAVIEPSLLSLFCRGVNDSRKAAGKECFDDALLATGKQTIVADFYRNCLADQPEALRAFIEDELVTDQGYRNSFAVLQATDRNLATREQIATLVQRRLLRIEYHLGAERVELTHDLLTLPVLEGRKVRVEARWRERTRRTRQRMWLAGGVAVFVFGVLLAFWYNADSARNRAVIASADADRARDEAKSASDEAGRARDDAIVANHGLRDKTAALEGATANLVAALTTADGAQREAEGQAERATLASREAALERDHSRSRGLAAASRAAAATDRELALLLALQAIQGDTAEAHRALADALQHAWPTSTLDQRQLGGEPAKVALSADGERLATIAGDGMVWAWDVSQRTPRALWPQALKIERATTLAFAPDGRRLAIGRGAGVVLVDTGSGAQVQALPPLPEEAKGSIKQITFSGDGRWLMVLTDREAILLRSLAESDAAWTLLPAKGIAGISVSRDGDRIIGIVTNPSLVATQLTRGREGAWTQMQLDPARCTPRQSMSATADALWVTHAATSCVYPLPLDGGQPKPKDETVSDTLPSDFGAAWVVVRPNGDLEVRRGDAAEGVSVEVLGTGLEHESNYSGLVALSEDARKLTFIRRGRVRVYSLARKGLMTSFESQSLALATDASWLATARTVEGGSAVLEIATLVGIGASPDFPRIQARAELPAMPEALVAAPGRVLAWIPEAARRPGDLRVFDAATGAQVFPPLPPNAIALGAEAGLLFVPRQPVTATLPLRPPALLRTRDGSAILTPWQQRPVDPRWPIIRFSSSPQPRALLVVEPDARSPQTLVARAYAVNGEGVVATGAVADLPLESAGQLSISDDAAKLTQTKRVPNPQGSAARPSIVRLQWVLRRDRVASARDGALVQPAKVAQDDVVETQSAAGGYLVSRPRAVDGISQASVLRRADRGLVRDLPRVEALHFQFSADDRWLAWWDDETLKVLDLRRGDWVVELSMPKVSDVEFVAGNRVAKVSFDDGRASLVPVDPKLAESFARWLVSREFDDREKCEFGIGNIDCRKVVAAARPASPASAASAASAARPARTASAP